MPPGSLGIAHQLLFNDRLLVAPKSRWQPGKAHEHLRAIFALDPRSRKLDVEPALVMDVNRLIRRPGHDRANRLVGVRARTPPGALTDRHRVSRTAPARHDVCRTSAPTPLKPSGGRSPWVGGLLLLALCARRCSRQAGRAARGTADGVSFADATD